MYHDGSRRLQDRFDTRRMADVLEARKVTDRIGADDGAFIEARDMFFLATADAEGARPVPTRAATPASYECWTSARSPSPTTTATGCT